ncbi:hypothetical protein D3C81_1781900 [compost metagenome]
MHNERDVEHIGIAIFMPDQRFHLILLISTKRVHRHTLMVSVEYNQTVIPQPAGLQLFQEYTHRIIRIILSPDIIAEQRSFVILRQLHLIFVLRDMEGMMSAHGNDHGIERLILGIKPGKLRHGCGE